MLLNNPYEDLPCSLELYLQPAPETLSVKASLELERPLRLHSTCSPE